MQREVTASRPDAQVQDAQDARAGRTMEPWRTEGSHGTGGTEHRAQKERQSTIELVREVGS